MATTTQPAADTAFNTRFILDRVGEIQGRYARYGVRDAQTGLLVRFRADGRWRKWSSVERAIQGANALNGREVYR